MSDYFACLDLINFRMSSALLALSPAGAAVAGAASGCGAGADSVAGATAGAVAVSVTGLAVGTDTCGLAW
jgi:hypothetical protein